MPKSSVVKSMSSNNAITKNLEYRKKSSSDAEFQKSVVKKRGVYVEKKITGVRLSEAEIKTKIEKPAKPPPRPRPDQKKFLSSILTILSKTTTGTQHPETNTSVSNKERRKPLRRKTEPAAQDNNMKKRIKYRSKILNNNFEKGINEEKITVLQSQKDITQTSSMYSENESINMFELPNQKAKNDENEYVSKVNNTILREILDGKQFKNPKRVRIDEPTTLVSETNVHTTENKNGLYNFFVDLIETTMNVSDVKDINEESLEQSNAASSTKILEIDESVAKKLNIQSCTEHIDHYCDTEERFCCFKDNEQSIEKNQHLPVYAAAERISPRVKRLKAKSFSFITKPKQNKITAESTVMGTRKSSNRKTKKQKLLNLFKEQLKMVDDSFAEPQNLYQALKVIAQNKKRNQRSIHFEEKMRRERPDYGFPDCMYRRRKVILPDKKAKNKPKKVIQDPIVSKNVSTIDRHKNTNYMYPRRRKSNHSLKVFEYDYENLPKKQASITQDLVFPRHSSSSDSDHALENDFRMSEAESVFIGFSKSPSVRSYLD